MIDDEIKQLTYYNSGTFKLGMRVRMLTWPEALHHGKIDKDDDIELNGSNGFYFKGLKKLGGKTFTIHYFDKGSSSKSYKCKVMHENEEIGLNPALLTVVDDFHVSEEEIEKGISEKDKIVEYFKEYFELEYCLINTKDLTDYQISVIVSHGKKNQFRLNEITNDRLILERDVLCEV